MKEFHGLSPEELFEVLKKKYKNPKDMYQVLPNIYSQVESILPQEFWPYIIFVYQSAGFPYEKILQVLFTENEQEHSILLLQLFTEAINKYKVKWENDGLILPIKDFCNLPLSEKTRFFINLNQEIIEAVQTTLFLDGLASEHALTYVLSLLIYENNPDQEDFVKQHIKIIEFAISAAEGVGNYIETLYSINEKWVNAKIFIQSLDDDSDEKLNEIGKFAEKIQISDMEKFCKICKEDFFNNVFSIRDSMLNLKYGVPHTTGVAFIYALLETSIIPKSNFKMTDLFLQEGNFLSSKKNISHLRNMQPCKDKTADFVSKIKALLNY